MHPDDNNSAPVLSPTPGHDQFEQRQAYDSIAKLEWRYRLIS